MWPISVEPSDKQRELPPKAVATVGDQEAPSALVFDRPDESFDDRETTVLSYGSETLADTFPATPSSERSVAELLALISDQVPRTRSGPLHDSSEESSDSHRRGLLLEHGEAHDPARVVIDDDGDPPAEGPTLWQRHLGGHPKAAINVHLKTGH